MNPEPTPKIILFPLANYWLALPVAAVLKVVNFPPEFRTALNQLGLVRVGDRVIRLLDLHSAFNVVAENPEPFLILVQLAPDRVGGIPVSQPPTLLDLSLATVQLLPPSKLEAGPLRIVKYIAIVTSEDSPLEILLLDLEQLAIEPLQLTSGVRNAY